MNIPVCRIGLDTSI